MSRYLILALLTIPFIIAGGLNSLVNYKLSKISKRKFILSILFWLVILAGIIFVQAIYEFLFSNNLTQTEPLSLFDVIQITGIVFLIFTVSRLQAKSERMERRINDLHQELSIRLSDK